MKKYYIVLSIVLALGLFESIVLAQDKPNSASPPPPISKPTPPKLSEELAKTLEQLPKDFVVSRENRQEAYSKLLEAQRFIWNMRRFGSENKEIFAKDALIKAVELDPNLAEAYTALAELSLQKSPDIDEAILFSKLAVRLDKDNFGGHRFLARLYTIKSDLGRTRLNPNYVQKSITHWKEITRLDPRYAEAWAFLSAFYQETNQNGERIQALRNWLSSSTPLESGFYSRVLIQDGGLTPEVAIKKLGEALIEDGQNEAALIILTRAVSDSPENLEVVELLSQTLENVSGDALKPAIEALRQAVFANPDNLSLNQLLAQTIANGGNVDDAAKFLNDSVKKFQEKDKITTASFYVALGEIYTNANRIADAIISYQKALTTRDIKENLLFNDDDRDFAFLVITKMIEAYKKANRFDEAKLLIEKSRPLFGEGELSLDKEYINLLRESGQKTEALKTIQNVRIIAPTDYNLIRTEASVLADLGRVEDGVKLIQSLIDTKPAGVAPSIMFDDFINYLYISSLYTQSRQNEPAIINAKKAIESANGKERKQIAQLALASAQQSSGDFTSAEQILMGILRETPENPIALNNLGYLLLESSERFDEALSFINKAVRIDPRNPSYLDSLGWAYYKLGKYDEAEKHLKKAIRYDSASSTLYEHLGDVYLKKGKTKEAVELWRKALKYTNNPFDTSRIKVKLGK